ncbi:CBS domain-containing protein [Streptacidiphilus anmyonensis]|uniref:CBS domain-containing protein n=1 Tax=Streptacidiphilus anmyonensis TaxID=405782 RepID=UPI0005A94AD6|nr:CBS domain-containing protein [Streptacidiphilus anmyonensis]
MTLRHRLVGELMTTDVVSARPDTPFKDIARLLASNDVSALPVLDDQDRPLGVVSEADLMRHQAGMDDPAGLLPPAHLAPQELVRSNGRTAQELMTAPASCARPEWTVVEGARVMHDKHLKRLPVVDEAGRLVGILSRSDLLRVFLRHDRAIGEEIRQDIMARTLQLPSGAARVDVVDGNVTLTGTLELRSRREALVRLCQGVDGVVHVADQLAHRTDDTPAPQRATAHPAS